MKPPQQGGRNCPSEKAGGENRLRFLNGAFAPVSPGSLASGREGPDGFQELSDEGVERRPSRRPRFSRLQADLPAMLT